MERSHPHSRTFPGAVEVLRSNNVQVLKQGSVNHIPFAQNSEQLQDIMKKWGVQATAKAEDDDTSIGSSGALMQFNLDTHRWENADETNEVDLTGFDSDNDE